MRVTLYEAYLGINSWRLTLNQVFNLFLFWVYSAKSVMTYFDVGTNNIQMICSWYPDKYNSPRGFTRVTNTYKMIILLSTHIHTVSYWS